ncbi:MAG: YceI family protein [Trueperaceae bacterium]|nr:YceI family protein [Trueperaceae bacterium]
MTRTLALALLLAAAGLGLGYAQPTPWVASGTVTYEARDALASWRGRADLASVSLRFDPTVNGDLALEAVVEPAAFRSGVTPRDANARRTVFEIDRFPQATARVVADPDRRPSQGADGARVVPVVVDLTLHGVTVRYPTETRPTREGPDWIGVAELVVSLEAHGMRRPSLLGLVTEDAVRLEVRVVARPDPAPTPTTR